MVACYCTMPYFAYSTVGSQDGIGAGSHTAANDGDADGGDTTDSFTTTKDSKLSQRYVCT